MSRRRIRTVRDRVRGMSTIEELQGRLAAAMDRIGTGAEKLVANAGLSAENKALADALEEEKLANAQLKERLRALHQKHFTEMEALQARLGDSAEVDKLRGELEAQTRVAVQLDSDLQRLRQANDQLRASNAALREANAAGIGEPQLINQAMLAELEGLRATRAADVAEAAAILARLEPMLNGVAQPADEEDA